MIVILLQIGNHTTAEQPWQSTVLFELFSCFEIDLSNTFPKKIVTVACLLPHCIASYNKPVKYLGT